MAEEKQKEQENEPRVPKEGDVVVFHDEYGKPFNALITDGGFQYSGKPPSDYTGWLNVLYDIIERRVGNA